MYFAIPSYPCPSSSLPTYQHIFESQFPSLPQEHISRSHLLNSQNLIGDHWRLKEVSKFPKVFPPPQSPISPISPSPSPGYVPPSPAPRPPLVAPPSSLPPAPLVPAPSPRWRRRRHWRPPCGGRAMAPRRWCAWHWRITGAQWWNTTCS